MKINEYNQMMAYLTKSDKKPVIPKSKPKKSTREAYKEYLEIRPFLDAESQMFIEKELGFAMGGSVETPKRGLVDEPGSYGGKEFFRKPGSKARAIELLNQGNDITTTANILVKEKLVDKLPTHYDSFKKKTVKNYSTAGANFKKLVDSGEVKTITKSLGTKLGAVETAARNDKILKIIKDNPDLNIGQIAEKADVNRIVVDRLAKKKNINVKTRYDQLLPEVKALDKLIKKNAKYLSGSASIADKRRFLFAEMQKQFGPNYTVDEFTRRVQTLGNRYVGELTEIDAYKNIKGPKNYKNSALHKNIVGMAKGDFLGVVDEARLLGLPKKQIQLLEDVLKGASKLTKIKLAGDHTDINALMKNFGNYRKNFMRINIISDRLNVEKLGADQKLIKLVKDFEIRKGGPNPMSASEFNKKVKNIRNEFMNKTKVPIGKPVSDARGNVSLDFQTDRIIDIKNPKNKAITKAVTNLIEQEGVKFSDFDVQYSQANTVKDRLNLLKNTSLEALQKSKIIKGFAEMSGDVGQVAKNILKTKAGKAGALAGLFTLATAAGPKPTETDLIDEVALTKGAAESYPTKTASGAAAAALFGTKTGRRLLSKGYKGLDRFLLRPLTAIEAPTLAIPQSLYGAGKLATDVAKGQKTDVGAIDITLPTSLSSLAASKKFGLDLFADNAGRTKRFLRAGLSPRAVRLLSRGSVYATPIIETGIQGYNAYNRLQEAKERYGMNDTVATALGQGPRKYVQELISELPEIDRSGAAGGGIAKLAGIESGPQRVSMNPDSEGLASLLKRGR